MSETIRLAPWRIEQLRTLAANEGKTVPEIIGEFIADAIAQKRLSPDLPGVSVRRENDKLTIESGSFVASMSANAAPAFSAGLRATLQASVAADKERVSNLLNDLVSVTGGTEIIRSGNHVSLRNPVAAHDLVVPKSVVPDLADQIDRAVSAS